MGSLLGTLESRGTWSYLSFENKRIYTFSGICLMCMYMYDVCVCACVCRHVVTWQLEDNFLGLASLSTPWVLEIKLRSSGLAVIPFTLVQQGLLMWPRKGCDTSGLLPFSFFVVVSGPEASGLASVLIATLQEAWNNRLFAHQLYFLTCKVEIGLYINLHKLILSANFGRDGNLTGTYWLHFFLKLGVMYCYQVK